MPSDDLNDLQVSYDGDLILKKGDLATTENDGQVTILQYIQDKLNKISNKDRLSNFTFSGGPLKTFNEKFVGRQNNKELGLEIELELKFILTEDGVIKPAELEVKAFPLTPSTIGVRLAIQFIKRPNIITGKINISETDKLITFIAFDTADGSLFSIDRPLIGV